jgi:hypothetical protein
MSKRRSKKVTVYLSVVGSPRGRLGTQTGILALVFILTVMAAGLLLIRYDTPAAAEFTDNVLRPVLGPEIVIFLEKIYYNFADKVTQITYRSSSLAGPGFLELTDKIYTAPASSNGSLSLAPLMTDKTLPPVADEGIWKNRPMAVFPGQEVLAYTFIRPDHRRPYAFVTIIQADMKVMHLSAVAGTKQPGGPVGRPGQGVVPANIQQSGRLIAAFDGGFQYRDGEYGMIVGGMTYLPLKSDIGTLIGTNDGTLRIVNYAGQNLGPDVEFVRQNCPILIENGELAVVNPKNKALWGRTNNADIYTWRSGVGLTQDGNLLFAVGNNLTPVTLASALQTAGARDALQLDINPFWVRFNLFDSLGGGKYRTSTLIKGIADGSREYLNGYVKDFFYLYKR